MGSGTDRPIAVMDVEGVIALVRIIGSIYCVYNFVASFNDSTQVFIQRVFLQIRR